MYMEGFQFREAVAEDKEDILDIDRNVYSGGDYLEKVYDEWAVQVTKSYDSKFYVHVILRIRDLISSQRRSTEE